jgi:acyl-CoA oxidase
LSSGQKSFFTKIAYEGIDALRQACGGAGFSCFSGLPSLLVDYAPNTTFEGDNTVMAMQSARYLIKTYKNLHKGFKATNPVMKYLNNAEKLL